VTEADFHNIAVRNDASKAERLFRASVSAFCTLPRPSRREVAQLDDLTLPLYPYVSVEARRFVAAALSECPIAPPRLIDRLADDRVDIAAPLLMRSALLTDIDLIALIGRHGLPYARAVARRPGLNPTIMQLIRALEASAPAKAAPIAFNRARPEPAFTPANNTTTVPDQITREPLRAAAPAAASIQPDTANPQPESETKAMQPNNLAASLPLAEIAARQVRGQAAEAVRERLREVMRREPRREETYVGRIPDATTFPKLRDAAFTGDPIFFHIL